VTFDLTPKQEAFAQAYLETGNASAAYRKAYDAQRMQENALNVQASRMLKHPKVALRIEQLQRKHQKRHEVTIDTLTEKLEAALAKAMAEPKGASAAVSAVMGIGKLHGLIVDKQETTRKRDVADITDAELADLARSGSKGASEKETGPRGADPVH
jgi:hypothetical protein